MSPSREMMKPGEHKTDSQRLAVQTARESSTTSPMHSYKTVTAITELWNMTSSMATERLIRKDAQDEDHPKHPPRVFLEIL